MTTFVNDVQNGLKCNATKYAFPDSWNCTQLRNFLISQYALGLRGAIFIGQVPNFTYDHSYLINASGPPQNFQFSWDYYYMELDGIGQWQDGDGDGIVEQMPLYPFSPPEIWVSRIDASHLIGNETAYYEDYFTRNHLIRNVGSRGTQRGLVWADDTWNDTTGMGPIFDADMSQLYPLPQDHVLYGNTIKTNKSTYLTNLSLDYEWFWANIHSDPDEHYFEENKIGPPYNIANYIEINQTQKNATFWNLYCCSTGDYMMNYLAGYYIFGNTTNGQVSIACPRSGGFAMGTNSFYRDLSWGLTIGDAWRDMYWYAYNPPGWVGWQDVVEGTNLFGDASLRNCMVNTTITIDTIANVTANSNVTVVAQIHDKDLWYLYGLTLQYEVHNGTHWNVVGTDVTNNQGKSSLEFDCSNLPLGTRQVRVTYAGDPNFKSGSDTENFTISSPPTPIPIELLALLAASGQQGGITDILLSPIGLAAIAAGVAVVLIIIVIVANKKAK